MKALLLAAALLAAGPAATKPSVPAGFREPPVLMFHRVSPRIPTDPIGRDLTLTPAAFGADLAWLKAHGIRAIDLAELENDLARGVDPARTVVVTFDDGYADQYTDALPVLQRYGDRATFFIVTGMLGKPEHLTWRDLRTMLRDGMEIAGHGVMHLDLSQMTPAQQAFEIDDCVAALHRWLGIDVRSYAYPSGRFNRTTMALLGRAGIDLAVTTDPVYVLPPQNRFELTRVRVQHDWSAQTFGEAVEAALAHEPRIVR